MKNFLKKTKNWFADPDNQEALVYQTTYIVIAVSVGYFVYGWKATGVYAQGYKAGYEDAEPIGVRVHTTNPELDLSQVTARVLTKNGSSYTEPSWV